MLRTVKRIICTIVAGYILASMVLSFLVSIGVFRWEIICHRAPFLLIDVVFSKVEGTDMRDRTYGYDQHGEYIGFASDVDAGDNVISLMVFNPMNNYCDDIAERYDVAVWH